MRTRVVSLLAIGLLGLIFIAGCGTAPTAVAVQTQPPVVITVIVTATPPPPTATPAEPSITPLPTLPLTATVTTPVAGRQTPAAGTPRPATATRKPTTPSATVAPTPVPLTRPAPKLIRPNFNPDIGQKDERHSPQDALIFEWESIGALGQGECYQIRVDLEPGQGDTFVQCDPQWTQKGQSQTVQFVLYQPNRGGPNYSALLPNPPADLWVNWYVTVVRDEGMVADGVHHKTIPLSPKSDTFRFLLKGGGA